MRDSDKYFAVLDGTELLSELKARVEDYYEYIKSFRMFAMWNKAYNSYYGRDRDGFSTVEIGRSGTQGELSVLKANHIRNLLQHLLVMTTGQRPHLDARAINTDYKSQVQTILAKGLLDFYMRERKVDRYINTATEYALIFGEGFIAEQWDAKAGDPYSADNEGNPVFTGDIKFTNYAPLDVIRDINEQAWNGCQWVILRDFENKYDLASQYPSWADKLLAVNSSLIEDLSIRFHFTKSAYNVDAKIPTFTFFHKKCASLPEGRMVKFVGTDIKLIDSALPYRNLPVRRISPAEFIGSPFGYTVCYDLLSVQDAIDALYSTIATNQLTFGVQCVTALEGSNISAKKLATGLKLLTYSKVGGKPEPLNLTYTPPEIMNFLEKLETLQETLSAVNSVNRGNPEASLRTGAALALVASQAIQFNSGLQNSYAQLVEDVGTDIITMLQDYAMAPRVISIIGKNQKSYIQEFKSTDIDKVNRVIAELGNPVMRTSAGRLEMANNLLQQGLIKRPEDYLMVIQTGKHEPLIESETKELLLIKEENEAMSDGNPVQAVVSDDHPLHMREHRAVLSDPETRKNPAVVEMYTMHQMEHYQLWSTMPTDFLTVFRMEIPQGAMMGQQMTPQQPGPAPEPEQKEAAPGELAQQSMEGQSVDMNQMLPKNPMTGEKYDITARE